MWKKIVLLLISLLSVDADDNCGRIKVKVPAGLSFNGIASYPGQFPWLAPIVHSKRGFICGSSIITHWHLLTTANCVISEAKDYHALLGRFDLKNESEPHSIRRSISEIIKHEDYNETARIQKSNGDIAIFKMSEIIKYTDYIQPICLPATSLDENFNLFGIISGYGQTESIGRHEDKPSYVYMSSVDKWDCLGKSISYTEIISERSYCAQNATSIPCAGDAGGGFYVYNSTTRQFTTYGIISAAVGHCNPREMVVVVDVSKYLPWIREKIDPCSSFRCNVTNGPGSECEVSKGVARCSTVRQINQCSSITCSEGKVCKPTRDGPQCRRIQDGIKTSWKFNRQTT